MSTKDDSLIPSEEYEKLVVPPGYQLVVTKNGEVVFSEDLEGYDLLKPISRSALIGYVAEAVEKSIGGRQRDEVEGGS